LTWRFKTISADFRKINAKTPNAICIKFQILKLDIMGLGGEGGWRGVLQARMLHMDSIIFA
jgi:hypothetical protein